MVLRWRVAGWEAVGLCVGSEHASDTVGLHPVLGRAGATRHTVHLHRLLLCCTPVLLMLYG